MENDNINNELENTNLFANKVGDELTNVEANAETESTNNQVNEPALVVEEKIVAPIQEQKTVVIPEVLPEKKYVVQANVSDVNKKDITEEDTARKIYKRILHGKVKSNKGNKTIIVAIVRQVKHPLYKKYYKRTKCFVAHDENNDCNMGDTVRIKESRPLSATKRWVLLDIVQRAK